MGNISTSEAYEVYKTIGIGLAIAVGCWVVFGFFVFYFFKRMLSDIKTLFSKTDNVAQRISFLEGKIDGKKEKE